VTERVHGRHRAVLAMFPKVAEQAMDREVVARLSRVVDLDPGIVLDDFGTATARRVLAGADILLTGWGCPPIDQHVLDDAPRLRAIVHSAGTIRHHVTEACWDRGIVVSSAAAANAIPVAEYTVAMILLSNKRVFDMARVYRAERTKIDWNERYPDAGNYRKSVGILSASTIGRRVIELLQPYDLDVLLHDPYVSESEVAALGARRVTLQELFRSSDLISVHTPLLPETTHMVGRALLSSLRAGSTLINTSRGAVLDQQALTEELLTGRINAVLDVTDPEILPPDSPLFDCANVLITPHIAGSKGSELGRLMSMAVSEVENFAQGRDFRHAVSRADLPRLA
jgi:phosphoglycerate dehydrogenase-like enzyme